MNRTAFPVFPDLDATLTWPPEARVEPFEPLFVTAALRLSAARDAATDMASARLAATFDEGFAAGRAEALREAEEGLSTLRAQQQGDAAAARQDWVTQEANRLASLIEHNMEDLKVRLRADVASILAACVARAVDTAIVDAFSDQVARAVGRMSQLQVTIAGRADLSAAVVVRLASRGVSAVATVSDDVDLKFELGETIITAVRPATIVPPQETH